jgi:hypothetical protein
MRLSRQLQRFAGFCMFTAGTQAAIAILTSLGWLHLDTWPKAVAVDGYLVASVTVVVVGGILGKRALRRDREQAKHQAGQWQPVPGRPGVLHREAVVEFHGLPMLRPCEAEAPPAHSP